MNEVMNSGALNFASLVVSLVVLVVGLVLWFLSIAPVRVQTSRLNCLEALLDQQKRQNALLRRLCESNEPEKEETPEPVKAQAKEDDEDFIRPGGRTLTAQEGEMALGKIPGIILLSRITRLKASPTRRLSSISPEI